MNCLRSQVAKETRCAFRSSEALISFLSLRIKALRAIWLYLIRNRTTHEAKKGTATPVTKGDAPSISFDRSSRIWLVGCSSLLYHSLSQQGFTTIRADTLGSVKSSGLRFSAHRSRQITHLIVDADAVGGLSEFSADLKAIRQESTSLPIILINSTFDMSHSVGEGLVATALTQRNGSIAVLRASVIEADRTGGKGVRGGRGLLYVA